MSDTSPIIGSTISNYRIIEKIDSVGTGDKKVRVDPIQEFLAPSPAG